MGGKRLLLKFSELQNVWLGTYLSGQDLGRGAFRFDLGLGASFFSLSDRLC